jgi:hypothetical protein
MSKKSSKKKLSKQLKKLRLVIKATHKRHLKCLLNTIPTPDKWNQQPPL